MTDKRFIEDTFPVKEVSIHSAKEKNIRHGHISTLHIWWARRPLAASRATAYAALIPAPKNEKEAEEKRNFIAEFSKWENSLNQDMIERARKDILEAYGGIPPKVLDPFGGGGAIPLECLRLGCETYSNDYNPVAVLIQKCTLEYPQKYGHIERDGKTWGGIGSGKGKNPLLEDVKKWGNWVLEEARKELGRFYPPDPDGSIPVGYIWARTIPCQNPSCGAEIPLMRQFWMAKKDKKKVSLYPYVEKGQVKFKVVGDGYEKMPSDFDPEDGTVARAKAKCLVCGSMGDANTTRRLFQEKKSGERMVAVVTHKEGKSGKNYRIATGKDTAIFKEAEKYLENKREELRAEWGMDPVPDEPTPEGKGSGAERAFSVRNYGMNTWGDLFNSLQKLSLIFLTNEVRKVYNKMIEDGINKEYSKSVVLFLALSVDKLADFGTTLCVLNVTGGRGVVHTFGRQTLPMCWDYFESNPFHKEGAGWPTACQKNEKWIKFGSSTSNKFTTITQSSATSLPYEDSFFDAILTDPPYYDNVPYSYLSDFFYVWLKRTIGNLYPEFFSTMLTPKKNEIVAYSNIPGGFDAGKKFFEDMLKKSFQEIYRVLKPDGISIIVYAHKSTQGWETLINSLLDSGLIVTGSWPLNTEMGARLRSQDSAALASSIYIIARKTSRQPTGFYNEVQIELIKHLDKKLDQLWKEGISGADFFISAIGSAIEVFGKYEKVIDYEGNVVRADRMLDDVRKLATDYAVHQILHNGFAGEISELTRLYVLWRWEFGEAKVPFDDGKKLAMSCGIDLALEWGGKGFIHKEKEFIRMLGPQDRKLDELTNPKDLIDHLHKTLLLWEKGNNLELTKLLKESNYGTSEAFYRVGQAISESLPNDSKEKKLLEGFLTGKEKIIDEVRRQSGQAKLFDQW